MEEHLLGHDLLAPARRSGCFAPSVRDELSVTPRRLSASASPRREPRRPPEVWPRREGLSIDSNQNRPIGDTRKLHRHSSDCGDSQPSSSKHRWHAHPRQVRRDHRPEIRAIRPADDPGREADDRAHGAHSRVVDVSSPWPGTVDRPSSDPALLRKQTWRHRGPAQRKATVCTPPVADTTGLSKDSGCVRQVRRACVPERGRL